MNEPRKLSSEFEVPCPSTKLFHLEQFATYGISLTMVVLNSRDRYEKLWLPKIFALFKITLQQALAEKANLDALILL